MALAKDLVHDIALRSLPDNYVSNLSGFTGVPIRVENA